MLKQLILDSINRIAPEQKRLLVLRDIHGLSYDVMAKSLGLDVVTLKCQVFRARLALNEKIKGETSGDVVFDNICQTGSPKYPTTSLVQEKSNP